MTTEKAKGIQPPHLWIRDVREEDSVRGCYLVKGKKIGTTRKGEPFVSLILVDRTGELEAKIWERAEELGSRFQEGDVVHIEGQAGSYRNHIQVTVSDLRAVEGDVAPEIFMESAPQEPREMIHTLRQILRGIRNRHLKALVDRFLVDQGFVSQFEKAPAAKNFHHCYLGGLLEHTLGVCRLAEGVAKLYPQLDGDLLLSGAFLHDIGKIKELKYHLQIEYSDHGRLIGHLVLGVEMVEEVLGSLKGFPRDLAVKLKHLILSHHGQFDFGSPKRPKFLEAFALHLIDDLDAKMNGLFRFMQRDRQEGAWTDFSRLFERFLLKGEMNLQDEAAQEQGAREIGQRKLF